MTQFLSRVFVLVAGKLTEVGHDELPSKSLGVLHDFRCSFNPPILAIPGFIRFHWQLIPDLLAYSASDPSFESGDLPMLLTTLALAMAVGQGPADWYEPFPAHKVIGNVYYVGSKDLATFLITTPDGHILINSGFERTVPLIKRSVESLGFKMTDVKILLVSHAHSDHVAGHAMLQKATGAKVYVMRGDDQVIASGGRGQYLYTKDRWEPCNVDRVLEDRDEVKLGGATLVARSTPGHTRGCTTWTWRVQDGGKSHAVVVIGSPNVNPGFQLVNNKDYPEIAADFAKTFKVLKSLPCDVFLGAHGGYYGMVERYALLQKGQANAFVNPEGYKEYVAQKERAFRKTLATQRGKAEQGKAE